MEVAFVGAAQTVTGSKHVVRTPHATVLLDCGLFQGPRREAFRQNRDLGLDPASIDAVVLSHAHIDHSGALPSLVKRGFGGVIYATSATRDLCAAMLVDAAMIQGADARYVNRLIERGHEDLDPVQPLYDEADARAVLEHMITLPYRRTVPIAPGVRLTFLDAGHVLGSAIVCLDVDERGGTRRLVFTGDLGRHGTPLLHDPELPEGTNVLLTESTYGDRLHKPIEQMDDELADVVARVHARGGKIVIPSFALERAQQVLHALKGLRTQGRLPPLPVYVDSPLTVKITDVYRLHPECMDAEARRLIQGHESPFDFAGVQYVDSVEDSKAIDASPEPAIIISASGMCEAGRVLHHLRATLEDRRNAVVIVGFQAPHTLGRRLVERRDEVRVFGLPIRREAEVIVLNGFSAHADQRDLVAFARGVAERGALERIVLVHGEPAPQRTLAEKLDEAKLPPAAIPRPGDRLEL
jgi:metallo-beta-lactamase family protein